MRVDREGPGAATGLPLHGLDLRGLDLTAVIEPLAQSGSFSKANLLQADLRAADMSPVSDCSCRRWPVQDVEIS